MQNQQVMGILKVAFRRKFEQFLLYMQHRFARAQPSSVGNSKNMRVHRNSRFSKRGIQDNVCGFAADTRESFQCFSVGRHLSVVQIDQHVTGSDDVVCFCVIQTDCSNVVLKAG